MPVTTRRTGRAYEFFLSYVHTGAERVRSGRGAGRGGAGRSGAGAGPPTHSSSRRCASAPTRTLHGSGGMLAREQIE